MIIAIIVVAIVLNVEQTAGQTIESTKCTPGSSMTPCAYSQIRCPDNYYFNGKYCLPIQVPTIKPTQEPESTTPLPATKCSTQSQRLPKTVPPTNPPTLPVKPVCERFYEWNGHECYKVLSNEPICPQGHNLTADGRCVSVLQALCQQNYYQHGDYCVGILEAPVVCPNNFYWDGSKCLYQIIPSCPDGFVLNNGFCELVNAGACPSGTIMDNYRCIGHHQVLIECDYGYSWDGNNCVNTTNSCEDGYTMRENVCEKYIVQTPEFECPPRTQMIGNECVSVELICPKGFTLIDAVCVEQIQPVNDTETFITPNCTTGFVLVGCECVDLNETSTLIPPATPLCPPNYVYKDGLCYIEPQKPLCPTNYELVNGICVHLQTPTNPPTTDCPSIDCRKNYSTTCVCPTGYALNNGLCILTGQESKVCPAGYQLVNGKCVLTTQPDNCFQSSNGSCLESICPYGTQSENGVCVLITSDCPPGFQKEGEACVPSTSTCPNGYRWSGVACVIIDSIPIDTIQPVDSCPQGYYWINGACENFTTGIPIQPEEPVTEHPTIPSVPPIVQPICTPCPSNNASCPSCSTNTTPCQPCPSTTTPCEPCTSTTTPCQPCPSTTTQCQPCPSTTTPCQPCPSTTTPCQPCPSINTTCSQTPSSNTICQPCPTFDQKNPESSVPPTSGCSNCPQTTHYITKDGHISITNIVNVAHHHQRPSGTQIHIPAAGPIDESFDYENNWKNATDEDDATKKCCEVTTPRQCKRTGDEWTCYHKKYQRCGEICTQPKIYLRPKVIHYQPPILIMPPPPRRIYGRRRYSGGAVDCSGCINGGYRCSVECYSYPDCRRPDCAYIDQDTYCEEWDHNETEGCSTEDGYYE